MGRRGGQLLRGTPALPARAPRSAVRAAAAARGLVPLVVVVPGLGSRGARGSARPARATARVRALEALRQVFLLATRASPRLPAPPCASLRLVTTASGCSRSLSAREAVVCV